jgi:hypothetical protein
MSTIWMLMGMIVLWMWMLIDVCRVAYRMIWEMMVKLLGELALAMIFNLSHVLSL